MTGRAASNCVFAAAPLACLLPLLFLLPGAAFAHDLSAANAAFVASIDGPAVGPFLYLGAKHMVTGVDHVLFLIGVVFFLYRLKDVFTYVSMFTLGHSLTLLLGVLLNWHVNPYMVDAIIGLSVVYKAYENMGGFRAIGLKIDTRAAVFAFGLAHGMGLATKLLDTVVSRDGLLINLISFNVGVELGQVIVLAVVVALLNLWRATPSFTRGAFAANVLLMAGGFVLTATQIMLWVRS